VSIETLLDLSDVSLDELIGWLKPVEQKMNRGEKDSLAKLNLTEDELVAWLSFRLKTMGSGALESSNEASSGSKHRLGCGHGRGRNSNGRRTADGGGRSSSNGGRGNNIGGIMGDECCYCGKKGHWARECK
jgi:hypothetical protein